jgi:hypothetical protein
MYFGYAVGANGFGGTAAQQLDPGSGGIAASDFGDKTFQGATGGLYPEPN